MNLKTTGYNLKRVSKVNLSVVCMAALLILIESFIYNGFEKVFFTNAVKVLIVISINTIVYFVPIKEQIKGGVFSVVIALVALQSNLEGPTVSSFMLMMLAFSMSALYFQKELIVVISTIIDVIIIVTYMISPLAMANSSGPASGLTRILVYFNVSAVLIFLLAKWGRELVDSVILKENESAKLLDQLKLTMDKVSEVSVVLDVDLNRFSQNIESIKQSNDGIVVAMTEVAVGVQEQAVSIGDINENMLNTKSLVEENKEISDNIAKISGDMIVRVEEGSEKISQMNNQMKTISKSVGTTMQTVEVLKESVEEISIFLQSISRIATQTNLLALNASIEAARAGENGKGFAVVADEVRKLAEESSATVSNINKVTQDIAIKVNLATNEVKNGASAIELGNGLISEVTLFFNELKANFNVEDKLLKDEIKKTQKVFENFVKVNDQIESISAISQEHSATNEEFLASIEAQNMEMSGMLSGIKNINGEWNDLKNILLK